MDIKKDFRDFSVKHMGNSGLATDQYMGMYGPSNLTPYIMEERRLNVAQMDVFSRLMMDRIIFQASKKTIFLHVNFIQKRVLRKD